jgi:hypothetical protein
VGNLEGSRTAGRIKIRIKDAARATELELQAVSFVDLKCRAAEASDELLGRQSNQAARLLWLGRRFGSGRLLRTGRTGSYGERE